MTFWGTAVGLGWLLCAAVPVPAHEVVAETASADEAPSVADGEAADHQRWEALRRAEPFLDGEDAEARRAVGAACIRLDAQCLDYLRDHRDQARRGVPDNAEYWRRFRALIAGHPVARSVDELERRGHVDLIRPAADWAKHRLLLAGRLEADEVYFQVSSYRRLLAESRFLIDKMIHTATLGIGHSQINVLMAQVGTDISSREGELLDEMLEPLSLRQRSMRPVFEGELAYARVQVDNQSTWSALTGGDLADLEAVYGRLADRSEVAGDDFWENGVELPTRAANVLHGLGESPQWGTYLAGVRYLDLHLHVLRALREMYAGHTTPGMPSLAPPAHWAWSWDREERALCLDPVYVHVSLGEPQRTCFEYLSGTRP